MGACNLGYIEGVELAQEEVKASGGVKARKLRLVVEDIRFDQRATASASKKLLDIDCVPISLISNFTEVQVAGPIFERAKVPLVVVGDAALIVMQQPSRRKSLAYPRLAWRAR